MSLRGNRGDIGRIGGAEVGSHKKWFLTYEILKK